MDITTKFNVGDKLFTINPSTLGPSKSRWSTLMYSSEMANSTSDMLPQKGILTNHTKKRSASRLVKSLRQAYSVSELKARFSAILRLFFCLMVNVPRDRRKV